MGKKEKLIKRLLSKPKDFSFTELETLLVYFGYYRSNAGKTSGSAVEFTNIMNFHKIKMHRPHGRKELLHYQITSVINSLKEDGWL